jgi:hypothetical protein
VRCWARFVIIPIIPIGLRIFSIIKTVKFDRGRSQINADLIMSFMFDKRSLLNPPAAKKILLFFYFFSAT